MSCEVYRGTRSAQIQTNTAKLIRQCRLDNKPKLTANGTKKFLKPNNWDVLQRQSQLPHHNPTEHALRLLSEKLKAERPSIW